MNQQSFKQSLLAALFVAFLLSSSGCATSGSRQCGSYDPLLGIPSPAAPATQWTPAPVQTYAPKPSRPLELTPPAPQTPSAQSPVVLAPVAQSPATVAQSPVVLAPVAQSPATVAQSPVVLSPVAQSPVAPEPNQAQAPAAPQALSAVGTIGISSSTEESGGVQIVPSRDTPTVLSLPPGAVFWIVGGTVAFLAAAGIWLLRAKE